MDLKQAIVDFELGCKEARQDCEQPECVTIVLAAARAFACETCGGTGFEWKDKFQCNVPCHDCKADREKARRT